MIIIIMNQHTKRKNTKKTSKYIFFFNFFCIFMKQYYFFAKPNALNLQRKSNEYNKIIGKMKVFDGIPAPYDTLKRKIVTDALKIVRLKNYRKFCKLGDLCNSVGWHK